MGGYTTVWRHWTLGLVAPSLSAYFLGVLVSVVPIVAGGVVCHDFVSRLPVPQEPWDIRLLVESVVFPTDFPLLSKAGLQSW